MILPDRIAHAVAAGRVSVAYRRWARPRVRPGNAFRTVAGLVRVGDVTRIDPDRLRDDDARQAGYASAAGLLATFRGSPSDPVFRIALAWDGPDVREELADNDALTPGDTADIAALLDRLDAATPWSRTVLVRMAEQPGVTAAELAAELAVPTDTLKRRIRRLKEHGLTRSLRTGYELSARGHAYLRAAGHHDTRPR